jgi:hypothetical protein
LGWLAFLALAAAFCYGMAALLLGLALTICGAAILALVARKTQIPQAAPQPAHPPSAGVGAKSDPTTPPENLPVFVAFTAAFVLAR